MRRFFVFSTVLGMVFVFLSLTSMPALGNHDPDVIHVCMKNNNGQLRAVSEPSQCNPSETPIELKKAGATEEGCPDDMVEVGDFCIDKYEAQVVDSDDNPADPTDCNRNGNDCMDVIFARSVAGVTPSGDFTWFQAQQACLNVGKRLPWNAEWQGAAAGTPDTGGADDGSTTCNTDNLEPGVANTGSRENCVSNFGAFDMVGNVFEWAADWIQDNSNSAGDGVSTALYGMDGIFGIDDAVPEDDEFPAALIRGGGFGDGSRAGVFALGAGVAPSVSSSDIGFRCARNR